MGTGGGFTPTEAGEKQKAEFLLYKTGQANSYLRLHLWVDIKAVGSQ